VAAVVGAVMWKHDTARRVKANQPGEAAQKHSAMMRNQGAADLQREQVKSSRRDGGQIRAAGAK
jgi:hypothetical protein